MEIYTRLLFLTWSDLIILTVRNGPHRSTIQQRNKAYALHKTEVINNINNRTDRDNKEAQFLNQNGQISRSAENEKKKPETITLPNSNIPASDKAILNL